MLSGVIAQLHHAVKARRKRAGAENLNKMWVIVCRLLVASDAGDLLPGDRIGLGIADLDGTEEAGGPLLRAPYLTNALPDAFDKLVTWDVKRPRTDIVTVRLPWSHLRGSASQPVEGNSRRIATTPCYAV